MKNQSRGVKKLIRPRDSRILICVYNATDPADRPEKRDESAAYHEFFAVVSVSGFTPFRTDSDAVGDGGLRRWSHLYGWLPRLGLFVGRESAVPVDFPEILAAKAACRAQNAADNLQFDMPTCLAGFNNDIQSLVIRLPSTP